MTHDLLQDRLGSSFMRPSMPGKGDSGFPCLFSVAMAKEPKQKQNEHVGSGWKTERIMGEACEAAPEV